MSAKAKTDSAENFVGSVFKFSISTFVNMAILGVSILITGNLVSDEVFSQIDLFVGFTNVIMTVAVLGMDQALIRFYYNPPGKLDANGLFRICFYFSSVVLFVVGVVCSTLLMKPIYNAIGFELVGMQAVPLLFLNAFFYMVARYFNVLYRMEMNVKVYTIESILMQFFYKLFYLAGAFFKDPVTAMMLCSLVGLGGFALVFSFLRRDTLRPRMSEFKSGAYKTTIPYGLAIAPTAVFITFGGAVPKSLIKHQLGMSSQGVYSFALLLSNIVAMIQGGFAAFWGAYMFENYETQRPRIQKMHDYLNFVILVFFCFLVAFEDILFLIFREYTHSQALNIFPMMMLGAVFTILCETTVYGNAIAKRPVNDTLGIGLSLLVNIGTCALLVPRLGQDFGLYGAAFGVALANFVMFLFRTITAQMLYRTIRYPAKTAAALVLAVAVTAAGTMFARQFLLKLVCSLVAIGLYCLLYRTEMKRCIRIGLTILQTIWNSVFKKGNG